VLIAELESESAMKDGVNSELRARLNANIEVEQQQADRIESLSHDLIRANVQLESLPKLEGELAATKHSLEIERQNRHSAEVLLIETETSRVAAEKRAGETKVQIDKLLALLEFRNP